ncbi:hypothetical protein [Chelatococcus asaccharovorans]|uniref:Uncharacterized protein n=1 Tax=Chelatococcus asaccharovorans TaxID=28210 RepID=A0A2V3U549_9HYPH|nr:hypothetical protein [Chelatococcus asaccharovorans]MBS7703915.1 hypothetical protein [Chelatococcus asaccharovorans]PXW58080.1 hypothetical protein C7450_106256 [Chelatococcus asaccharovorans]
MFTDIRPSLRWRPVGLLLGFLTLSSVTQAQSPPPGAGFPPAPEVPAPGAIIPAPSPSGEQIGRLTQSEVANRGASASAQNAFNPTAQSIAEGRVIEDRAAILEERLNKSSRRAINSICRGC